MALDVGDAALNIDDTLDAFLAEQCQRLSPRTYRNYEEVVELFRRCMNDYGHTSLTGDKLTRWEERYENDDHAYTAMFGPEMIPVEIGQFLGWYVTRKVMPSQELARACGTVTKTLGRWLESNGHLDADAAAEVVEWGEEAYDEMPKAEQLSDLLYAESRKLVPTVLGSVDDEDWVEDMLLIERVEDGELWFEGGLGPVAVAKAVSDLARPGWMITITLTRLDGRWRVAEVGNVYT